MGMMCEELATVTRNYYGRRSERSILPLTIYQKTPVEIATFLEAEGLNSVTYKVMVTSPAFKYVLV